MNFSAFISSPHSSKTQGRRFKPTYSMLSIGWWFIHWIVLSTFWTTGACNYLTQICIFHKQRFLMLYKDWLFARLGHRLYTACKMKYRACRSNLRLFDNVHTPHWRPQWYVSRTAGQGPDPRDTPGNWNILFQLVLAQKSGSICSSLAI